MEIHPCLVAELSSSRHAPIMRKTPSCIDHLSSSKLNKQHKKLISLHACDNEYKKYFPAYKRYHTLTSLAPSVKTEYVSITVDWTSHVYIRVHQICVCATNQQSRHWCFPAPARLIINQTLSAELSHNHTLLLQYYIYKPSKSNMTRLATIAAVTLVGSANAFTREFHLHKMYIWIFYILIDVDIPPAPNLQQ